MTPRNAASSRQDTRPAPPVRLPERPEVPQLTWQKSSYSGDENNSCLYLAATPAGVLLRESDAPAEVVATTPARLGHLVQALKAGRSPVRPSRSRTGRRRPSTPARG
ncbi:DUF397 domain-containing protein [Streptomyces sp. NPDC127119]|uniref:DUF397 domain-containing protein n=1 Tax=Streptomyces sp. NPDC127119 TaxID=3345370 RepID=UPI0036262BB6